ncbi:MAG: cyclase family protein [Gammaproteobacteria bacterium]|nr:MAG: cyclase family protein [Gammaproteobacteria bacterium]
MSRKEQVLKGAAWVLFFSVGLLAAKLQAEECKPVKWGADDEIGSANLVTPKSVLLASQLIKKGKTQHLGIIIDKDTPAFGPRTLNLQIVQPGQEWGREAFANGFNYNDDIFQGWFGIGSQLDGLGHVGQHQVFYNCLKGPDFVTTTGVTKMGIEKVPPIVARGIVLDMAAFHGVEYMKAGELITVEDVEAVAKKQGTPIREGDVVLFHTGWTDAMMAKDPQTWGSKEPGISEATAKYLAEKNVVAVGADTWGVDPVPPEVEGNIFAGHITLLLHSGIYLLETMNTGVLVRDNALEFFFVLGVPRVRGAVQAMIDPIAIY